MDDKTTANGRGAESNMVDPVRGDASNGADEAKDQGAISKPDTQPDSAGVPAQPQAEPEVQILEEHVTHAAQKPVHPVPTPVAPTAPPLPPVIKSVVTPAPPPGPVVVSAPAPTPVVPPKPVLSPAVAVPPENPALSTDIAKILSSVKLPERRDTALPGEKKTPAEARKFDTGIVGSALTEAPAPISPSAPTREPGAPSASASLESTPASPNPADTKTAGRGPGDVSAVHTLKDDLQGVVHDQKISLVKAVSLEEDRRAKRGPAEGATPGAQQRSNRTFGIVFASLTLLLLGAGALFGVLFIMNQKKAPPQIDTGSSILFSEQSTLLSLNGQSPSELKRVLEAGRTTSQGALGSITRIIPVISETAAGGVPQNRPASFKEFMTALGARASDDLYRALGNDFFLGIHAADKSAPLIVVPVVSHPRAFAAMLNWEASLGDDLSPLFTTVSVLRQDANGLPVRRTYEDLVMRNYDVRALKDDAGDIQLYYSFPTQNILIIAESPYSFPEILSRLQASRQL